MPSGPHAGIATTDHDHISFPLPDKLLRNLNRRRLLKPVPMRIVLHKKTSVAGGREWLVRTLKSGRSPLVLTNHSPTSPYTPPMATFDALADLPLEIEGYELEPLELQTPGFDRLSTVIHMWGGGEDGLGEDVTYDAVDHIALQDHGPSLDIAGFSTLGEFCELIGGGGHLPGRAASATSPASTAAGPSSRRRSTWPCARQARDWPQPWAASLARSTSSPRCD